MTSMTNKAVLVNGDVDELYDDLNTIKRLEGKVSEFGSIGFRNRAHEISVSQTSPGIAIETSSIALDYDEVMRVQSLVRKIADDRIEKIVLKWKMKGVDIHQDHVEVFVKNAAPVQLEELKKRVEEYHHDNIDDPIEGGRYRREAGNEDYLELLHMVREAGRTE